MFFDAKETADMDIFILKSILNYKAVLLRRTNFMHLSIILPGQCQ